MVIIGFSSGAYTGSETAQGVTATVNIMNGITFGSLLSVECSMDVLGVSSTIATAGEF